jgi:hypothetical protein
LPEETMNKLRNEPTTGAPEIEPSMAVEPHAGPSARKSKKDKAPKPVTRKLALTAAEQQRLEQIRLSCGVAGGGVSQDQLLRAALYLLAEHSPEDLAHAWKALAPVKGKKARK